MPARQGRLVVLTGPSGVGKSTIVARMRQLMPELRVSVSATTREQRPGERDGVDYYFIPPERFDQMVADDEFLEWASIHKGLHRSGTPEKPVRAAIENGVSVLTEVDLGGARALRARVPEAYLVFLAPPNWDELVSRLRGRGTEAEDVVARRLQTAQVELAAQGEFDEVVVNQDVERTAADLVSLVHRLERELTTTPTNKESQA
ncbi:MAG: guanylate kinase [Segniliparus sp.]|uniref:guanylate kinase n=1 Tax=Segniliparus sp. TaxID=2804064 RepID=UPI003F2A943F